MKSEFSDPESLFSQFDLGNMLGAHVEDDHGRLSDTDEGRCGNVIFFLCFDHQCQRNNADCWMDGLWTTTQRCDITERGEIHHPIVTTTSAIYLWYLNFISCFVAIFRAK